MFRAPHHPQQIFVKINITRLNPHYVNINKGGSVSHPFLVRSGSDLGRAVGEARRASGLTQTEFAAQMGFDQAYLARLERGHSVQLLDRIIRSLRALDADLTVSILDPRDAN